MSRGTVRIRRDHCKACRLCLSACPQQVLRLSGELNASGYHPVMLDEGAHLCTGCGICFLICPDNVFTVLRESPSVKQRPAAAAPAPRSRNARAVEGQ